MIFCSCCENKTNEKSVTVIPLTQTDTIARTSITFILGKDDNTRNPYYALANQYYRLSETEKTEIVIDSLISLTEVRNYLAVHRPVNKRPWGLINLVTHGNEFVDLSVYVSPTGSRVSEESLQKAIDDSVFLPLDSLTIDDKTLFNLHGCAVGNNTRLLNLLGVAFGGGPTPALVKASRMFEYYAYLSPNKNPQSIRHYYARVWYGYYKVDSLPDEQILTAQLKNKYPNDSVDWVQALRRQYPSDPSQVYHMNLHIPVVWEDFYESKNEMPDLRTKAKQDKWVDDKTEFLALLSKTAIPREYFRIKFYTLTYSRDSGIIYSGKVKGMAGIICIIKPEVKAVDVQGIKHLPYIPADNDNQFFSYSVTRQNESNGLMRILPL